MNKIILEKKCYAYPKIKNFYFNAKNFDVTLKTLDSKLLLQS